jgi:hypothetical protein
MNISKNNVAAMRFNMHQGPQFDAQN